MRNIPSTCLRVLAVVVTLAVAGCSPAVTHLAASDASPAASTEPVAASPPTSAAVVACPDHEHCRFDPPPGVVHDGFRYQGSNDAPATGSVGWWEHETLRPPSTHVAVWLCNGTIPFDDSECGPPAYGTTKAAPDPWGATGSVNGHPCGGALPTCRVLACESGGDPTAENSTSSASGLWQIIDGTWNGHAGYRHASHAPPYEQNVKAAQLWAGGAGRGHWRSCL